MLRTKLLNIYPCVSKQSINTNIFMKRKYGNASLSFSTFNDKLNQTLKKIETVENKTLKKNKLNDFDDYDDNYLNDKTSRSSSFSSCLDDDDDNIKKEKDEIKYKNKINFLMKSVHYELMIYLEHAQCKSCKNVYPLSKFTRKHNKYYLNNCYRCRYDKLMENPFHNVTLHMFNRTKDRCRKLKAKGRHLEFNLTHDKIKQRILEQKEICPLSGIPFTYLLGRHNKGSTGIAWKNPSIDRIDSNKGYLMDNIIITTVSVNMMKNELPMDQFIETCKLITNNHNT